MSAGTVVAIITVTGMVLGSVVTLIKHFKSPNLNWQEPLEGLKTEVVEWRKETQDKITDLQQRLMLAEHDLGSIDGLKLELSKLNESISAETTKLEGQINNLMTTLINILNKNGK